MKHLPVVRYEGRLWFFDASLRQLRTVRPPLEFQDLNDFEMTFFEDLVANGQTVDLAK